MLTWPRIAESRQRIGTGRNSVIRGEGRTQPQAARRHRCLWIEPLEDRALLSLLGLKTIGPSGNYASITAAIADIQSQGLGGALTLELQANYVSSGETFPVNFSNLPGNSAANPVTLRPASGATNLAITSSDLLATVSFDAVAYVTIDGRSGGTGTAKNLTIENTSTNTGAAVQFIKEAGNNTIQYVLLKGAARSATAGVVFFGGTTTAGVNGNDNNTIDHCDIGDSTATSTLTAPTNAIYSAGTVTNTAKYNSNNTISNNNIYNFYSGTATVDAAGVLLSVGTTDWTITGNSFYQTGVRDEVAATSRAIYVNNAAGNNFTVTNNVIGGSGPNGSGTWTTTGTTKTNKFVGIQLSVGSTATSNVQGNTIKNFAWTTASNNTTLPGMWSGIYVQTGSMVVGTTAPNTIGSASGTGSISITTSGAGGTLFGIGSSNPLGTNIANNVIGSLTTSSTGVAIGASIIGIQVTAGANTIAGNTIGSAVDANSITASAAAFSSTLGQQVVGILSSSASGATITDNVVANLTNNFSGPFTGGRLIGITTTNGANTIAGNTVRGLTTATQNADSTLQALVGISQTSSTAGQDVSRNIVQGIGNTAATAGVYATGIYYSGPTSGTNNIARNLVDGVGMSSTSAAAVLAGIQLVGGTFTAQNNMVRVGIDGTGSSTAGAAVIRGIYDNGTTAGRSFYHNSVYVGGSQTAGAANTFAFSSDGATNTRAVQDNVFMNARGNAGGTGKHYAVQLGGAGVNPAGLTSNANIFYAPATGGVLGLYGGADRGTLADWQAATGQDAGSFNADPLFVSPTTATVDLHMQDASPASAAGVLVASVTDDFDGELRSTRSPTDIGADAFGQVIITPSMTAVLSSGTLTITDTDPGGRDNSLTVSITSGNLVITDAVQKFSSIPPEGTLSADERTLTIPFAAVTGGLIFNTAGGKDLLTIDLSGGNVIPTGSITFNGGNPATAPGDKLTIIGGNQGNVAYTYSNAHDGKITMSSFGTVNYTGLEPVVNTGAATNITITLPSAGSTAVLEDDGVAGNGLSQIRSLNGSFETTSFANPSGTLTVNRGNAADSLTISAVPEFSAGLTIGTSSAPLAAVTYGGAVTLNAGKSLFVAALTQVVTGSGAVATSVGGEIKLTADAIDLNPAGLIDVATGIVTILTASSDRPVSLGVDSVSSLSLTDAELDRIVAGTLRIGNIPFGGPIAVNAPINLANNATPIPTLHLSSVGGLIDSNTAGTDFTVANLAIEAFSGSPSNIQLTTQVSSLAVKYFDESDIAIANAGPLSLFAVDGISGVGNGRGDIAVTAQGPLSVTTSTGSSFGTTLLTAAGDDQLLTLNSIVGGSGDNSYIADRMVLSGNLGSSGGKVLIAPESVADAGDAIQLGLNSAAPNVLAITDDTWFISGKEIQIGDAQSGPITIAGDFSPFPASKFKLVSGGAISFTNGAFDVANTTSDLMLSPGPLANINVSKAGADVKLGSSGTLSFAPGSRLAIAINGVAVDTQYQQLNVTGKVDLSGVELALSGNYTPAPGESFTIVSNDGTDAIVGTFNGMPEGQVVSIPASTRTFQISYRGGDGNDVVLTAVSATNPMLAGTASDESWFVKRNATNLEIKLNGALIWSPPFDSLASLTINGLAGNDSVTVDLSGGDAIPAGSLTFNGGNPTVAPGDLLEIVGGDQGIVAYNYSSSSSHDGSVVMSNYGTVNYTGLEPITNSGSASDLIFNLPPGPDAVTLADDDHAGNSLSRLSGSTFEQTNFANPTGSLTLNANGTSQSLAIHALPDFHATLRIGNVAAPFGSIDFAGAITFAADQSLEAYASGSLVLSAATSDLAVSGSGSVTLTTGRNLLLNPGASVSTVNGDVTLTATASTITAALNWTGIRLNGGTNSPASITTSGSGKIRLDGKGGSDGGSNLHYGVHVINSRIQSTGTGVIAGGIAIIGTGGFGGADQNQGVRLEGSTTEVSTVDGDIAITGTATTPVNAIQDGVHILNGVTVKTTGLGELSLTGTAGSSDGTMGVGVRLEGLLSLHGARNTFTADRMVIDPVKATIDAGLNVVVLQSKSPAVGVDLGSATDVGIGVLELSEAELDRITAGTLRVGSAGSGTINITGNISRNVSTRMELASAGSLVFTTGSISTAGGDLLLSPGVTGGVRVPRSGGDLSLGVTGTLGFSSGSDLAIAINGKAVDAQYDELSLIGKVDLTGVDLVLTGSYSPAIGDVFAIINNDGTDDVIGEFNGLPDGKLFHVASGAVAGDYVISYHAGSGNDVFIMAVSVTPRLGEIVDPPAIDEDANQQTLGLTGIAPGFGHFVLNVTAVSSNPALLLNPSVNYTGGTSAVLSYKPLANQFGSATITVTVQDDGGTAGGRADSVTRTFVVNVLAVNDRPNFQASGDQAADDENPATQGPALQQVIVGWAKNIDLGPANETGQQASFVVENNNQALFTAGGQPAIDASGRLTYTPAANAHGTAIVKVVLHDGGGGNDASIQSLFNIVINKKHKLHNAAEAGPRNGRDVTGATSSQPDGFIVAGDVLAVINYINAQGAGSVTVNSLFGPPYPDVNGDDQVVAEDALAIINYINAGNPSEGEAAVTGIGAGSISNDLMALLAFDAATNPMKRRRIGG